MRAVHQKLGGDLLGRYFLLTRRREGDAMALPLLHRVVLTVVAVLAAALTCLLLRVATSDVAQCLWALVAGVCAGIVVATWWPTRVVAVPRPPLVEDATPHVETGDDRVLDVARAA